MTTPIVLIATAQGDDVDALAMIEKEVTAIKKTLEEAVDNGWIELVIIRDATIEKLSNEFNKKENSDRITIFHYAGHADREGLIVEAADGSSKFAYSAGLTKFLSSIKSLKLVFLNACTTEGNAKDLLLGDIQNVISTNCEIADDAAYIFAKQFYQSLAAIKTVDEAFQDAAARVEMEIAENNYRNLDKRGPKRKNSPPPSNPFPWEIGMDYNYGDWKLTDLVQIEVFLAYDQKDEEIVTEEFRPHIVMLERQKLISTITSDYIKGGDLQEVLFEKAEAARIILLLLSANFMAGKDTTRLVKLALNKMHREKGNVVVIPILLKKVLLQGQILDKYMPLPRNGKFVDQWDNRDAAFTDIAKDLREVVLRERKKLGLER